MPSLASGLPVFTKSMIHHLLKIRIAYRSRMATVGGSKDSCSPGGILPYMGYMGMCRCEGYGFQALYSRIGYINQGIWV